MNERGAGADDGAYFGAADPGDGSASVVKVFKIWRLFLSNSSSLTLFFGEGGTDERFGDAREQDVKSDKSPKCPERRLQQTREKTPRRLRRLAAARRGSLTSRQTCSRSGRETGSLVIPGVQWTFWW